MVFMLWLCQILEVIKIWKDFASKPLWNINCPCTPCTSTVFTWGSADGRATLPMPVFPPDFSWALAFSRLLRFRTWGFFYPVVFLFKAEQVRPLRGTVEQGIYQSSVPEDSNHFICSRTGIWCWWLLLSPAFFILMGSSMSRAEHFPRQVIQLFAWKNLTLPQTV